MPVNVAVKFNAFVRLSYHQRVKERTRDGNTME